MKKGEDRENLQILLEEALYLPSVIPFFIDTKSKEHYKAFEIIGNLISEHTFLIRSVFLPIERIMDFYVEYELIAYGLIDIINNALYSFCKTYVDSELLLLIDRALELEEYESVSNLTKFRELKNKDY